MRLSFSPIASSLVLLLPLTVGAVTPGSRPIIGTAVSTGGNFQVDHATASTTATVLDGDQVTTSAAASRITLRNGSQVELLPNSSTSIFASHATLEDGTLRAWFGSGFTIQSRNFTVRPTGAGTEAVLQTSATSLTVSLSSGSADIVGANGVRMVHMLSGNTLSFGALSADIDPNVNVARIFGTLDSENGHYLIRDRFSNTVSELLGPIPPRLLNHYVAVDGNVLTNQKPDVLQVDHLVQVSQIKQSEATFGLPCTPDGNSSIARIIHLDGALTKLRGHFLLADKSKGKSYELVGNVDDAEVGTDIEARGFILPNREAIRPAEQVVYTEARKYILAASPCAGLIIGGAIVSTGIIVWPRNQTNAAASLPSPISY